MPVFIIIYQQTEIFMKRKLIYILTILIIVACNSPEEKRVVRHEKQQESEPSNVEQLLVSGERIDGPANIREGINGKLLFKLQDNTPVETGFIENDWYPVGLWIDIDKKQEGNLRLLPGQKIFSNGIEVGQAVDTVEMWTEGYIAGMTYKDNIIPSTIPEVQLSNMINKGKTSLSELQPFIDALQVEPMDWGMNNEIMELSFYEGFIIDPSAMHRISLLFKNEQLIAVNHSRPMTLPDYKTYQLKRNYKMTIIGGLNKKEIEELVKDRNHLLNSVD